MIKLYDLIVVGGGPGGITAGIYAKRAGLDVVIIERNVPGGAITTTSEVENYTGITKIGGIELATKMFEHASSLSIPFIWDEVKKIIPDGEEKVVECYQETYKAKAVIIAVGASVRKLNIDKERQLIGKGVSYCATCDGSLYKDKIVAIVGGGNTALEDCLYLSNISKKVYLIHRREEFRGQNILVNQLKEKSNVQLILNSVVSDINGDNKIESIVVENKITKVKQEIKIDGLFICIGRGPDTEMIDGNININSSGYIITDENMKTNYDGIYAIGDIRNSPLKQILCACSDGAIASTKAFEYIKTKNK